MGTWTSNNKANDIVKLIEEFERKVKPAPAQLAIGFTGQYYTLLEDNRIGGTHGPFRTHILIREWSHQVTEPERLEILVHEMGHYFGAAHSSERQSVMRPDISDRQSRREIFKSVSTLATPRPSDWSPSRSRSGPWPISANFPPPRRAALEVCTNRWQPRFQTIQPRRDIWPC